MRESVIRSVTGYVHQTGGMAMYGFAIVVFVGLVGGNFMYQAFTERRWDTAVDRSIFQAVALGAYLIAMASR